MAYSQCRHPKYIIHIIKLEFLEHFYNFKVSQGQKHSCINNTPKKKEKKSPRTFLTPGIRYGKKKMLLDDGLRRDAKYFDQTGYLDLDPSGRCCFTSSDRVNHAGPTLAHWLLPWGSDAQLCPFRHRNVGPVGSKETRLRLRSNSPFIYRKFKISNSQNNII